MNNFSRIYLAAALFIAAPITASAATGHSCADPESRKQTLAAFYEKHEMRSAEIIRDVYSKKEGPLQNMTPALEAFLNANMGDLWDVVKAMNVTKDFDYQHFVKTFRRYPPEQLYKQGLNWGQLSDDELIQLWNSGLIFRAVGILSDSYNEKLDELSKALSPEETRRAVAISDYVDQHACEIVLNEPQDPSKP